jgi:hypothetical protein
MSAFDPQQTSDLCGRIRCVLSGNRSSSLDLDYSDGRLGPRRADWIGLQADVKTLVARTAFAQKGRVDFVGRLRAT